MQQCHAIAEQDNSGSDSCCYVIAVKEKKGKKVDRLESRVPDPANWDTAEAQVPAVQTLWKPEKMKKLTYTQFWNLVKEHKVDKVGSLRCCQICWA